VLEGTFDVMVDGEWTTLQPGHAAQVPVGALHTFRNATEGVARSATASKPALLGPRCPRLEQRLVESR
jgi:quercetin dioxygenase-like cupin family protein